MVARAALLTVLAAALLASPAQATFIQEFTPGFIDGSSNGQEELTSITLGPDGNLWVINNDGESLARVTPDGGLTEFPVGVALELRDIAVGPDGNFWITANQAGGFVIVSPSGRVVKECYNLPSPGLTPGNLSPEAIARVGDRVFFTSKDGTGLVSFDANCGDPVWGYSPPAGNDFLEAIDGKLWVGSNSSGRVYRIAPFPQPTREADYGTETNAFVGDITLGPDGNVWFTLWNTTKVGRIAKDAPDGTSATLFSSSELLNPQGIAAGPDGNVWIASQDNSRIARVTPAGAIATFTAGIGQNSQPTRIATGPDGDLWFTELKAKRVGRVLPDQPPRATSDVSEVPNPTTATVRGTVASRGATTAVVFEYGTTTAYGSAAAAPDVGAGVGSEQRTAVLSDLAPDTVYHFRVKATTAHGTATGADLTFKTPPGVSGTDKDRDGISPPADCNDSNPAIRPGARDIPGNKVDEDCDGADDPFRVLPATISSAYRVFATYTLFSGLSVKSLGAGLTVRIVCKGGGCPKNRTIKIVKARKKLSLMKFVRGWRLKPGARVEIRVTAPDAIGKVRRLTFRRAKLPRVRSLCMRPGAKKPHAC